MVSHKTLLSVLVMGNVLFSLGFSIIMPILPYYSRSMGASALDLGLLVATFAIMQVIFAPFWGRLSDRIGRKPVFLVGLFGYSMAFVIYSMADQLWMLFLGRAMSGFLSGGIYPASLAYIADMTDHSDRGRVMGLLGAAGGIGMIIGPIVSGVMSRWGMQAPFIATAILAFVFGVVAFVLMEETKNVRANVPLRRISVFSPLGTPLGFIFLMNLAVSFLIAGFQATFSYFMLDRFGLDDAASVIPALTGSVTLTGPEATALMFTAMGIAAIGCQGLRVGPSIDAFGERKTVLIGFALSAVAFFMMLLSPELVSLLILTCLISVGTALVTPCVSSIVSGETEGDSQGAVMGVLGSYGSLGRMVGPPICGISLDVSMFLPYLIAGGISIAGAIAVRFSDVKTTDPVEAKSAEKEYA